MNYNSESPVTQSQQNEFQFSEEQRLVVEADKLCHISIQACAGSGKTTTILQRVNYLIKTQGVDPRRIFITTFTLESTKDVRHKLSRIICDQNIESLLFVNNIDKFTAMMLSKFKKSQVSQTLLQNRTQQLVNILNSNSAFKLDVTSSFDYIFFDEFQDIKLEEYKLLKMFAENSTIISIVGDSAQDIFGFSRTQGEGATSREQLEADFPGMKFLTLSTNYRSLDPIIQFGNSILQNSTRKEIQEMQMKPSAKNAADHGARLPQFNGYDKLENEIQSIIQTIINMVKGGEKLDEIAILAPTNGSLQFLEEGLEKHNTSQDKIQKGFQIPYVSNYTDRNDKQTQVKFDCTDSLKTPRVTLTTIHKAKGLEWNLVIVIGLNDAFFPNSRNKIDQDRSLFYVAATRARHCLMLSFFKSRGKQYPTRFISEIPNNLYSGDQAQSVDDLKTKSKSIIPVNLTQTLGFLNIRHNQQLNSLGILTLEPEIIQIHRQCNLSNAIINNRYVGDFVSFLKSILGHNLRQEITSLRSSTQEMDMLVQDQFIPLCTEVIRFFSQYKQTPWYLNSMDQVNVFASSLKRYTQLILKKEKIQLYRDIFNVSISKQIIKGRKRLVENNVAFSHFMENWEILENIKLFQEFILDSFQTNPCPPRAIFRQININQSLQFANRTIEVDFDIITFDTIYQIELCQKQRNKTEDIIEIFAKAAFLESILKITVQYFIIYYPLQGELHKYDITNLRENLPTIKQIILEAFLEQNMPKSQEEQKQSKVKNPQNSDSIKNPELSGLNKVSSSTSVLQSIPQTIKTDMNSRDPNNKILCQKQQQGQSLGKPPLPNPQEDDFVDKDIGIWQTRDLQKLELLQKQQIKIDEQFDQQQERINLNIEQQRESYSPQPDYFNKMVEMYGYQFLEDNM